MTNQIQISMNYKNVLIRLHTKFPQFDTDTLIEILNCMEENNSPLIPTMPDPVPSNPGITWITDSLLSSGLPSDAIIKTNFTTAITNKAEALN